MALGIRDLTEITEVKPDTLFEGVVANADSGGRFGRKVPADKLRAFVLYGNTPANWPPNWTYPLDITGNPPEGWNTNWGWPPTGERPQDYPTDWPWPPVNQVSDEIIGERKIENPIPDNNPPADETGTITELFQSIFNKIAALFVFKNRDEGFATSDQGEKADLALLKTGGTMSGSLILKENPQSDLEAATKAYVDLHSGGENGGNEFLRKRASYNAANGDTEFELPNDWNFTIPSIVDINGIIQTVEEAFEIDPLNKKIVFFEELQTGDKIQAFYWTKTQIQDISISFVNLQANGDE